MILHARISISNNKFAHICKLTDKKHVHLFWFVAHSVNFEDIYMNNYVCKILRGCITEATCISCGVFVFLRKCSIC